MSEKPTIGIAVDGYCRGNPGPCGYQGVDIETGEVLFKAHFKNGTNNIAEYLAVGHGLMYLKKEMEGGFIYTDSQTAIGWIINNKVNSNGPFTELSENYLRRIRLWLLEQKTYNAQYVKKWKTKEWGEIPADFGNK